MIVANFSTVQVFLVLPLLNNDPKFQQDIPAPINLPNDWPSNFQNKKNVRSGTKCEVFTWETCWTFRWLDRSVSALRGSTSGGWKWVTKLVFFCMHWLDHLQKKPFVRLCGQLVPFLLSVILCPQACRWFDVCFTMFHYESCHFVVRSFLDRTGVVTNTHSTISCSFLKCNENNINS